MNVETPFQLTRTRKTLQVIVCDDDPAFLDKLRTEALTIFSRLNVDVCISIHTSLADLSSQRLAECDIAFPDIHLNSSEASGIDILRRLRGVSGRALIMFIMLICSLTALCIWKSCSIASA